MSRVALTFLVSLLLLSTEGLSRAGSPSCPLNPEDQKTFDYFDSHALLLSGAENPCRSESATQPENGEIPATCKLVGAIADTISRPYPVNPYFEIIDPQFKLGLAFQGMSLCDQQQDLLRCVNQYSHSMEVMEASIASAAIQDPEVLAFARKMANRLLTLIRARATQDSPSKDPQAIENLVDQKLLSAYGNCTDQSAGCLVSTAYCKGDSSCLAQGAQRLRSALANGNLRETMFFLFRSNDVLTQNVSQPSTGSADLSAKNSAEIKFMDAYIHAQKEDNDWQLGPNIPTDYRGSYILSRVGFGRDNGKLRDPRAPGPHNPTGCVTFPQTFGDSQVTALSIHQLVPSPLQLIPLSSREKVFLHQQLGNGPLSSQPLPYLSGEGCDRVKKQVTDPSFVRYNQYLDNAYDAKIPMVAGISGTTDSILGLGRALGLKTSRDFELLRAAALGWMVSARDHSAHEIMTASESFPEIQPRYEFSPDYYKNILPGSAQFPKDVEEYQRDHGAQLPQEVLDQCGRSAP